MIKFIFILPFFIICACTPVEPEQPVIKYKSKSISKEDFVQQVFQQGFLTYGKKFLEHIHDTESFNKIKLKATEAILLSLFINEEAAKNKIIIKEDELNLWIADRTKGMSPEELKYFMKMSKISEKDWKKLFKDQLLLDKVYGHLSNETPIKKEKRKSNKVKKYQIGVLKFDSKLESQKVYKQLRAYPNKFTKMLEMQNNSSSYTWFSEKEIPFFKQVKSLRKGSFSKPFESSWGHLIVKLKNVREKRDEPRSIAVTADASSYLAALEKFKNDSRLSINSSLIEGLTIKN